VPRHKSPCVREGAGRDGDVGGDTSGPAPPPRGNRAGADEAGLLARGAVASLPGALTPVAGGAAADHGRLRVGSSYSGGAAPVSHRTSGWPRLPWIDCAGQSMRRRRSWQAGAGRPESFSRDGNEGGGPPGRPASIHGSSTDYQPPQRNPMLSGMKLRDPPEARIEMNRPSRYTAILPLVLIFTPAPPLKAPLVTLVPEA
jgi:hypothetical protein